jgi:hypothetical protein
MFKDVTGEFNVTRSSPPVKMNNPTEEFLFPTSRFTNEQKLGEIRAAKSIDELADKASWGTYVEAQIYGKVTIEDIESIAVTSVKKAGELEKALKKIGRADIKIVPCKYDERLKLLTAGNYSGPGAKYAASFTAKDIDNLGDFYIDHLAERWMKSAEFYVKQVKDVKLPEDMVGVIQKRISGESLTMAEKREWLKKFADRIALKAEGGLPKGWWEDYVKSYGGWTDDVFNVELLKRKS